MYPRIDQMPTMTAAVPSSGLTAGEQSSMGERALDPSRGLGQYEAETAARAEGSWEAILESQQRLKEEAERLARELYQEAVQVETPELRELRRYLEAVQVESPDLEQLLRESQEGAERLARERYQEAVNVQVETLDS